MNQAGEISETEPVCFVVDPKHVFFGRKGVVVLEGSPGPGDAHVRFEDGTFGYFCGADILEPESTCPDDLEVPKLFRVKTNGPNHRKMLAFRLKAAKPLLGIYGHMVEDTKRPTDDRYDALARILETLKRAWDLPWSPSFVEARAR